ncbi:maltose ABC transporter membrane protein /trehalose ABC transporter membrane protein /sucrose ABC transporter membrane protein [Rhodovulum bhavnagarense]|uniref:Maltose ABC transporter membrane protein /trehalose ABC transporter membrane protein /sucrose ABC transporter membrane protein n=1 Tax=Rhodovulum bhavnagarense TaxID=992286 RepID=A0A4R2RBZ8_9RHOB|nr:carbohydrate ABC transporter permease [Rhodovulum bhavnagarense]TCP59748.1 maltose ABC transporter membrane protein /trehalose ABC transporter membrane protein /sucrose ABC transporter membrane protein [Rhodovulum bhavnagarense]
MRVRARHPLRACRAANIAVLVLALVWFIPTLGLLVSSFRERDQILASGWWQAPLAAERTFRVRADAGAAVTEGGRHVIAGNVFANDADAAMPGRVKAFGVSSRAPAAFGTGLRADLVGGGSLSVGADGHYRLESPRAFGESAPTIYVRATMPPRFSLDNYRRVLADDVMVRPFVNTLAVTIPATVLPTVIAAFAAYALAWMEFRGRGFLIAASAGLLVVPLQLAFVPLLKLHQGLGIGQGLVGIWLAHTGFGLPLAVYLLHRAMAGVPRDIIDCARMDGASEVQIFSRIVLPLTYPALAGCATLQFVWVWNDLLVAKVFLPPADGVRVMTVAITDDLLGSHGGDWGMLAAAAFISMALPLLVFFILQRCLLRGLLSKAPEWR